MTDFNRWIGQHASSTTPPMTLLDTTRVEANATADAISAWVRSHL